MEEACWGSTYGPWFGASSRTLGIYWTDGISEVLGIVIDRVLQIFATKWGSKLPFSRVQMETLLVIIGWGRIDILDPVSPGQSHCGGDRGGKVEGEEGVGLWGRLPQQRVHIVAGTPMCEQ